MHTCNDDMKKAFDNVVSIETTKPKDITTVNLNAGKILDELKSMKERGTILHGQNVTSDDIYIQMTGLIVKLALEECK